MYAIYFVYAFAIIFLAIVTRISFMIFFTNGTKWKKSFRRKPAKTMIILGSGGHTGEMIRILRYLNFKNYSPRIYIHAETDTTSMEKVKYLEKYNTDYKVVKIQRSREIHQSYYTSVYTTVYATLESIPILWTENPELLLCNGPGTCVPLCLIAFLFKIFYITRIKIVFIESFCRTKTLSLTGKILYYLADHIIVQWSYLNKKMCDRTFIVRLVPWEMLEENVENRLPIEMRIHLMPIVKRLKTFAETKMDLPKKWTKSSLVLVDACLDKIWETLNSGCWQSVPIEYRYCYSLCTILKVILLEFQYDIDIKESTRNVSLIKDIIQQIDKGILLGAPLPNMIYLLPTIASKLNNNYSIQTETSKELVINYENLSDTVLPGFTEISRYNKPSMELFYRDIFMPKVPALLEDCIKHWKALERWQDMNYLSKVAGNRTVPIEIGSRYTDEDWSQQLLSFSEFLQKHVLTKNEQVGYLAQHQLFNQVPELKDDFMIPEYCNFTDKDDDEVEPPDINAWFGPGGTISPLHFDPKNNVLCQVFGYKRIILYHPEDSPNLYPYDTRLLNNTAQVDPLSPDHKKWPNFSKAKGWMGYLKPGDMLYIPPKWWHHVTALTPSFSISFWWN